MSDTDDYQAGRVAGDLMGLFLGQGGDILIVMGSKDITGHRDRERGFRDLVAERHRSCRITKVIETGEDAEEARHAVASAFREHPKLQGVYHLSVGARPIVEALEHLGRADSTVVITHELTPHRRALLKARKLSAVIDQRPNLEARLAVETIGKLLGRIPGSATNTLTNIQIFLPENA